jgi:hypothetical protein
VSDSASDDRVQVTFRWSADLRRRLRIAAAEQDREMQDIAAEAMTAWLTKNDF